MTVNCKYPKLEFDLISFSFWGIMNEVLYRNDVFEKKKEKSIRKG